MKNDNIFKFVSIRPPKKIDLESKKIFANSADDSFQEKISLIINDRDYTFLEAKLAVAEEYLNSDQYFIRSHEWNSFLHIKEGLQELITNQKGESVDIIKDEITEFFRDNNSKDYEIIKFLNSDCFTVLKRQIWNSYYSNIILINKRPEDRDSILFWLRFLYLIESTGEDGLFKYIIDKYDKLRPSVPKAFVLPDEAGEVIIKIENEEQKQEKEKLSELREELTALKNAKATVTKVFNKKLNEVPRKVAHVEGDTTQIGENIIASSGIILAVPWKLKTIDFEDSKLTLKTLKDYSLDLESSYAPELIVQIENYIAEKYVQLKAIQTKVELSFVKGGLVKVRRERR